MMMSIYKGTILVWWILFCSVLFFGQATPFIELEYQIKVRMNKYYAGITTNTILPIDIPVTYAYVCDNRSDEENWGLANSPSNAAL